MKMRHAIRVLALAAITALAGCAKIQDAQSQLDAIQNQQATEATPDCEMYKTQFLQTGDSSWLSLYNTNCQDAFITANTPAGLDADCQAKYASMVKLTDSLVMSLQGVCDSSNLTTKTECIAAKSTVDAQAQTFQKECNVSNFYYPTPDKAAPPTTMVNGQCAWKAWIPMDFRTGTDSIAMLVCTDSKPVCSTVTLGDSTRLVETHLTVEGDTAYLPCIQEIQGLFAPCDFNQDRIIDPIESQQCQSSSLKDPCDWNADGTIDAFEKTQCTIKNDSGFVNPGMFDPCDWNYDGMVDSMELAKCQSTYSCKPTEQPFFDAKNMKQVCIPGASIPECSFPTWPELLNGKVVCMDPCDKNRDGVVGSTEVTQCQTGPSCGMDSIPFFDASTQNPICVANSDIPTCTPPQYPEMVQGTLTCVSHCDRNMDGIVDSYESSMCSTIPIMDSARAYLP